MLARWITGAVFLLLLVTGAGLLIMRPTAGHYSKRETRTSLLAARLVPIGPSTAPIAKGPTEANSPPYELTVDRPVRMMIDRSNWFRITLTGASHEPTKNGPATPDSDVLTVLVAVPRPDASVMEAFGPGHRLAVAASVAAPAFDADLITSPMQAFDQERLTWTWNVVPKKNGLQMINLGLEFQWQPDTGGEALRRQLWQTEVAVPVEEPLISSGARVTAVKVITWVSATVSTAVLAPFALELLRRATVSKRQSRTNRRS